MIALLVLSGCSSDSKSSGPKALSVAKNLIVDTGGKRVVLTGASDYLVPFYTSDDGSPDPHLADAVTTDFGRRGDDFAAMRKAGYNTVRVPLGVNVYQNNPYYGGGSTEYLHRLQEVVTSAKAAGLYVIFGWWGLLGGQQSTEQLQPALDMMRAVAGQFAGNPEVLFEPVNEPNNLDWAGWQTSMKTIVTWWRQTIGYRGPLIIDTINYSWDFDAAQAKTLQSLDAGLLGADSQVVFANHRYANANTCFCGDELNDWQSSVGANVNTFPILGTEYGWFNNQGDPQPKWNSQLFSYLASKSVPAGMNGALAFVWHWVDQNSMTTDTSALDDNATMYDHDFVSALSSAKAS